MPRLTIYIDDSLALKVQEFCKKLGLSPSEWVSKLITQEIQEEIPKEFFKVLGTWEEDHSPKEILKEIRKGTVQKTRTAIE